MYPVHVVVSTQDPDTGQESALRDRALAGDEAALLQLSLLLTPPIQARVARALCRRSGAPDVRRDLEDLTQEVFVRLFAQEARVLRAWDPERGLSLVGFVRLVADREVANVFASGRRQPSAERLELQENMDLLPQLTVVLEGEQRMVYKDLLLKLHEKLDAWLTPRGRELFDAVYLEEQSLGEVAEHHGMKRSALYAWKNRVCNKARALFDELHAEDGRLWSERRWR